MGAELPRGRVGRFRVDVEGAGLDLILSSNTDSEGCWSSDGRDSTAGGGRPRPTRLVSAISAPRVAASGAGAEGGSAASETVTCPF